MNFPIETVRGRFPALSLTDKGRRRIYLDNPAGTQVPQAVADAVSRCLLTTNANLGGFFETTVAAQTVVDDAHAAMADFLGAASPEEIIVGANMTTLTYHMSRTLGRAMKPGDEIIVTRMDHEGNVSPWLQLAEDLGLVVRLLPFDEKSWLLEEAALRALLSERTRLVALNYASNLTGSINRVKALTAVAKQAGALVYVDAVQFAPHGLVDVQGLGCDFLVCSAYKFFGPHIGILWGRRDLIDTLKPYKCRCSSNGLPERFELGTPQIELMAGLTAAVDYFADLGAAAGEGGARRQRIARAFEVSIAHENTLAQKLIDGLSGISGLAIHGITDPGRIGERVPTVSFTVEGIVPETIVRQMNAEGIFLWSGHNYAWEIVHQLGIPAGEGVVRIGIAHYNTADEIDETLESVRRVVAMLRQQRA
ncbi:MAG: cysteine desulfurase-like protein [Mesorhizobium sp.]|uniref:cysteine desulfurase-like protein n=2 Tax=Mesorhizobium TaxID=68287 RepID=UPI000F753192|nr:MULTISPECIES: cysteine desulfurase-like protein [unclassified Mesorhizobium]AZO47343.1 cysteine desulfurase-like protein [Mesorhizobium sp. M4B.F.Ca.ET.058.02.1.1]RVC46495.1 cysteine desulfurase-like protein [Mesorhizobium sp. M4A.F.Ca.ET.090.04.2.1]RWC55765.1 MAG: cysteine desulfurase-like protein [Mesorhizobium sp.]RWD06506.1 MAG: cysteine desulfurase-like protein [Mesorhizobium sp.]RWD14084.1 MAG: cysteine desulfurase-like protein [Mesorhizobium sp.]